MTLLSPERHGPDWTRALRLIEQEKVNIPFDRIYVGVMLWRLASKAPDLTEQWLPPKSWVFFLARQATKLDPPMKKLEAAVMDFLGVYSQPLENLWTVRMKKKEGRVNGPKKEVYIVDTPHYQIRRTPSPDEICDLYQRMRKEEAARHLSHSMWRPNRLVTATEMKIMIEFPGARPTIMTAEEVTLADAREERQRVEKAAKDAYDDITDLL